MPIDPTSRTSERPLWLEELNRQSAATPSAARSPSRELDLDTIVAAAAHDEWLGTSTRGASTTPGTTLAGAIAGRSVSQITPEQARLDAYRASFAGPYKIGLDTVSVSAQFRMSGGHNDANAGLTHPSGGPHIDHQEPQVKELYAICQRAGAGDPTACLLGAPTARSLVRVTQALIDAGKLPPPPGSIESRVKTMQWQFGIGIDCTDYVLDAALSARQKSAASVPNEVRGTRLPMRGYDYFANADVNPHLSKVSVQNAKPGDVFCLDSPGDVGHRAVVYAHTTVDEARLASLAHDHGSAVLRFAEGGPVHEYQMDASWSAGPNGASFGGVRRDTWLYNESTKQWAQLNPRHQEGMPSFEPTPNGPAGDVFHGVYRFR